MKAIYIVSVSVLLCGLGVLLLLRWMVASPPETARQSVELTRMVPRPGSPTPPQPVLGGPLGHGDELRSAFSSFAVCEITGSKLVRLSLNPGAWGRQILCDAQHWSGLSAADGTDEYLALVFVGRRGEWLMLRDRRSGQTREIHGCGPSAEGPTSCHIHSPSFSHSGRKLAFMVSQTPESYDWDDHTLYVHSLDTGETKAVWTGDIVAADMFMPYESVQPLPWSPDDTKLLLGVPGDRILEVPLGNGPVREVAKGYLPAGYISADRLLVLRKVGGKDERFRLVSCRPDGNHEEALLDIYGPHEMCAPLIWPDGRHVSIVALNYPNRRPQKGPFQYTLVVSLPDLNWSLLDAEITSCWAADAAPATQPATSPDQAGGDDAGPEE